MTKAKKIITVIALLIATELIALKLNSLEHDKHSAQIVHSLNKEIKTAFDDALIAAEVVREMVLLSPNHSFEQDTFNQLSKELLTSYPNVDGIQYLPHGVVQYVYPYAEHKLALGHNVLQDEKRKRGADQSIKSQETVIIGPIKLVQNEQLGFVLRKGISNQTDFIGLSSSIVYLDSIIDTIEQQLTASGVTHYSIIGYNPDSDNHNDKIIAFEGDETKHAYHGKIELYNTRWDINIYSNNNNVFSRVAIFAGLSLLLVLIWTTLTYFRKYHTSERQRHSLQHQAHCDFLTGLLNRRGFDHRFDLLKKRQLSGSIAIFDIDFFKNINDSYGHDFGDMVLVQFAKLCAAHIADELVLSRTGGEEFTLLMPDTHPYQAAEICEQLRAAIAKAPFFIKHRNISITVSIGIASFASSEQMETAVSDADKALYQAKRNGRNQVRVYG